MMARPSQSSIGQGIKSGWIPSTNFGFEDDALKRVLFDNPRFSERIIDQFCETSAKRFHSEDSNIGLKIVVQNLEDENGLRDIGLAWCAPRLIKNLFDKKSRLICGELSENQVKLIAKFKDHVSLDFIDTLSFCDKLQGQFVDEGRRCILSWIETQDHVSALAIKLSLEPKDFAAIDHIAARSALYDAFSNSAGADNAPVR